MPVKAWLRLTAAVVVVLAVIGGVIAWYFRNTNTRLTYVPPSGAVRASGRVPRFAHVVVIIEENKSPEDIVGDEDAPYLNSLVPHAALFTRSYGIAHPSQPNYFALFAGVPDGDGDACDVAGIAPNAPNLGAELRAAHRSFAGYAEGLPSVGYAGCTAGDYARKHAPWTHFTAIPPGDQRPFTAFRYDALPTVAFVIPDLQDDMHSASVNHGDRWLRAHLTPLLAWAMRHDTLVVITWDESSRPFANQIPTFFLGPMVRPGRYDEIVTHYRVLRTIEDAYGLPHAGASAQAVPITDVWVRRSSRPAAR